MTQATAEPCTLGKLPKIATFLDSLKYVDAITITNNISKGISSGVLVITTLPLIIDEKIQRPKRSTVATIRKINLGIS